MFPTAEEQKVTDDRLRAEHAALVAEYQARPSQGRKRDDEAFYIDKADRYDP